MKIILNKIKWYLKQLFPLTYTSVYGEKENKKVCIWKMWFGKCFNIRQFKVLEEVNG